VAAGLRRAAATAAVEGASVGVGMAWLSSIREDVGLLTSEFLPEFLLITVLLLALWGIRRRFGRDARTHL
jgi:hypothetical protein